MEISAKLHLHFVSITFTQMSVAVFRARTSMLFEKVCIFCVGGFDSIRQKLIHLCTCKIGIFIFFIFFDKMQIICQDASEILSKRTH